MCILAEIQQLGLAGVLVLVGFSGLFWWDFFSCSSEPCQVLLYLCCFVHWLKIVAAKSDDFRKAVHVITNRVV